MNVGDFVIIEQKGHPYQGKEGKIVGIRGFRAPGDAWCLVYVMMRGRSYLIPESTLRLIEEKTTDNEVLIWPLTGKTSRRTNS